MFIAQKLVDLKVRQRGGGVDDCILWAGGLAELEVKGEIAVELPFHRGRVDRQADKGFQRVTRNEIGERIRRPLQMGAHSCGIKRFGRRVGNCEDDVGRLNSPPLRDVHEAVTGAHRKVVAGHDPAAFEPRNDRNAGEQLQ